MPELPEVQIIVSELNSKLKNKIIKSVKVNEPKMVSVGPAVLPPKRDTAQGRLFGGPPKRRVIRFIKLLRGQKIISVKRRAKLLIFNLSGPLSILAHLKMTGQFIFEDQKLRQKTGGKYRMFNKLTAPLVALPGKHTHVIFYFTDGSILYFNDVRKFGYLKIVSDGEISQVKEFQEYGLEPLSKEFSLLHFWTIVQKCNKRRIKEVLMDQKVVAGIGNIYSDEILFHSGVRPDKKVLSIKYQVLGKIYRNIKVVLKKAILAKGSSVGDFVRTDGSWGKMGKFHFVYGMGGQECKKCGTIIQSIKIGGRTASFCPKCQK